MGYKVHFDKIYMDNGASQSDRTEAIEYRNQRQRKWEETSQVVEGIPGRCVIVDRGENDVWMDKKLVEMWEADPESVLYQYYDIQCLSGTAGYILKLKDGKMFRQVTMVS